MLSNYIMNRICDYSRQIKFKNGIYCPDLDYFIKRQMYYSVDFEYINDMGREKEIINFLNSLCPDMLDRLVKFLFIYEVCKCSRMLDEIGIYVMDNFTNTKNKKILFWTLREIFNGCFIHDLDGKLYYEIEPFVFMNGRTSLFDPNKKYLTNTVLIGDNDNILMWKNTNNTTLDKEALAKVIIQHYVKSKKMKFT